MTSRFRKSPFNPSKSCREIEEHTYDKKIQDKQVQACLVKMQVFDNFLSTVVENDQSLLSTYCDSLLSHDSLFKSLAHESNCEESQLQTSHLSKAQNDMLILQLQNQKLKTKEKLLKQRLKCERLLREKIKGNERERKQYRQKKLKEKELLEEEITLLEEIIERKHELKVEREKNERDNKFITKVMEVIKSGASEREAEEKLLALIERRNAQNQ